MTAADPTRPSRRETWQPLAVAAVCALAFLGAGVLPTRSVVPFAIERYQPLQAELRAAGEVDVDALLRAGNVSLGDKYGQSFAWDRILQDRLRAGELPLWTPWIAGGAPFVPQMAQVYQPWNLLLLGPWPAPGWYGIAWFLHLLAYGLGAFWFLRRIGLRQSAALFGVVLATLGLWTQARIHHHVILSAALPLWPLLTLVHTAFARARAGAAAWSGRRVAAAGLLLGLSWSGGFAPVSLQVTGLVVVWALATALRERRARPLLGGAAALALGAALSSAQMVPTLLASLDSARQPPSPAELRALGLSWRHATGLLWPDLLHWPARAWQAPTWAALELVPAFRDPAHVGRFNWSETAFAVGLPATLLLPLAAWSRARLATGFALAAVVFGFGLATASSPFVELTGVLPGARAGDLRRFLFLAAVGLTVLAACGADALLDRAGGPRRALPAGLAALVLLASLALLLHWGAPFASDTAFAEQWAARLADGSPFTAAQVRAGMGLRADEIATNHHRLLQAFGRVAVLAALSLAALLALRGRHRVHALSVLVASELLLAGAGSFVAMPVDRVRPPAALQPVRDATRAAQGGAPPRLIRLATTTTGPSIDLWPPNLGAFCRIEDLGAYNPLPPRAMEELFLALEPDREGKPSAALGGAGVQALFDPASLDHPLLDLLGARYVLTDSRDLPAAPTRIDRTPAATPPPYRLLERTTTLPRATFVDTARPLPAAEPTAFLRDPDWDPRRVVHLDAAAGNLVTGDGHGDASVHLVRRDAERVVVEVDAREPGYLRLADPWDAGWTARVDGVRVPCLRADTYLRAVRLEPGAHRVVFRYDAPRVVWPQRIALAALLLCLGLCVAGGCARFRPRHRRGSRP